MDGPKDIYQIRNDSRIERLEKQEENENGIQKSSISPVHHPVAMQEMN